MIFLKHVEHRIEGSEEFDKLLNHLEETTSRIVGVELRDIWFPEEKDEFVLVMECTDEEKYLRWREICPPPPGAKDWCEVLLSRNERFPEVGECSNLEPSGSAITGRATP